MTLAAGTRLGPYEILAQIGEGGMGEVYKARDTRLDRIVAIKVLPPHLALNAEMRDRFQREAHAIASLQHPNICVLYDIGEQDGLHYLVMEYLEGETLALRLLKGLLPLDQVLRYAIEISDALDKAHRQGYTHRDIKPANIMLTKSGSKILDFGLAKLKPPITRTDIPFSEMPTPPPGSPLPPGYGPDSLTADGTILGTIFYMAPEQLEGKADDVDGRADIFSFGAMVYEMLTGKRAFAGKSQASVIASILKDEPPPMSTLQPPEKMTPPALDRLVKKCLAKDRDRRWQAASDVCDELKWIAEGGSQAGVAVTAQSVAPRKGRERVLAGVALLAIVTAVVLAVVTFRRTPVPEAERMLFSISTPGTPSIATGAFSVSPDGLKLAFVAPDSAGNDALWFRSLDSLTTRPLSGTEGAIDPFWSPDSRFVAFYSASKLNKVEISSGSVQTLTDAAARGGGAWNRDGVILFAPQINGGLAQVSETGGAASPLTTLDSSRQEIFHRFPQFLPDRRHFIYVVHSNQPDNDGIYLGSLDSKETRQLLKGGNAARYTPPDYLLFMRESGLMAQHLDPERLELTGEPVLVAQQVSTQGMSATGAVNFSVSETGLLAYANAEELSIQLGWFDRSGRALGLAGPPADYDNSTLYAPELSPDGKRMAVVRGYSAAGVNEDVWIMELASGTSSRFTFDPARDMSPLWSPDGSRILFRSNRGGVFNFYQKSASGAGSEELVFKSPEQKYSFDWSADGRFVLYTTSNEKTGVDLWVLPMTGEHKPFPYLQTPANEGQGQFSPDGKWVAYASNESGNAEVYIQSFPTPGSKRQVSSNGGTAPRWRRDGKEIFYISTDRRIMAAAVRGEGTLEVGVPTVLFPAPTAANALNTPGNKQPYDVTADGHRFLLRLPDASGSSYTVVLNWAAGLKK